MGRRPARRLGSRGQISLLSNKLECLAARVVIIAALNIQPQSTRCVLWLTSKKERLNSKFRGSAHWYLFWRLSALIWWGTQEMQPSKSRGAVITRIVSKRFLADATFLGAPSTSAGRVCVSARWN